MYFQATAHRRVPGGHRVDVAHGFGRQTTCDLRWIDRTGCRTCAAYRNRSTRPMLRPPKLQYESDDSRWARPGLDGEAEQARGIPRNLQLDETEAVGGGGCLVRSNFAKSRLTLRVILRSPVLVRESLRGSTCLGADNALRGGVGCGVCRLG